MHFLEYERATRLALLPRNTPGERKHIYLTRHAKDKDIIGLQETHGKDEFLQAIQVLVPNSGYLVRSYQTMSAGGSAIVFTRAFCRTEQMLRT